MITSIPSLLRLRVLSFRPHLTLSEIQLVDDVLRYRRLDARDHVPIDVRTARPSATDWNALRIVLDEAAFWLWPRRWPRAHDGDEGEFVFAVDWAGRVAVSAGVIGVAPEVEAVLDVAQRLVRSGDRRKSQARRQTSPTYRTDLLDESRALACSCPTSPQQASAPRPTEERTLVMPITVPRRPRHRVCP